MDEDEVRGCNREVGAGLGKGESLEIPSNTTSDDIRNAGKRYSEVTTVMTFEKLHLYILDKTVS